MYFFSLLRQEYPPILTSGEMLSHPGGWDKPIPEVILLWRHRTSTQNNLEMSRLVCVLDIFCPFLDKNEKNNQSPHSGRDTGIPSSCPRFATSTTRHASSWIANLGHSDGIPSSLPQCGVRFYYSQTYRINYVMNYFCFQLAKLTLLKLKNKIFEFCIQNFCLV